MKTGDPKFVQECLIVDTIRLIKEHAQKNGLEPRWVHTWYVDGGSDATKPQKLRAAKVRHTVLKELIDSGYPKDMIASAFDITPNTLNAILRKLKND